MKVTLVTDRERVVLTDYPFKLAKDIDLSGLSADMNIIQNGSDGGTLLNSRYNSRDFEIEGMINVYGMTDKEIQNNRELLYRVVNPKNTITIEIETDKETYFIYANAASFPVFNNDFDNSNKSFQRFLLQWISADPFVYKQNRIITFSNVTPKFSFPLTFGTGGIKMSEKNNSLIQSIYNAGMLEAPLEITIKAFGEVINPSITNVYTQEMIQLNTTLATGDEVVINTGRKKEVSRWRNGVKENFYYSLDLNSDFILLHVGDNIFRFSATSGTQFMQVLMGFQERMGGI